MGVDEGDIAEQLDQLRELSGDGTLMEGVFMAAEQRFLMGAHELRAEVERRQQTPNGEGGWRDPAEARELIQGMSDEQQREQFDRAMGILMRDLVRVPVKYHEVAMLGGAMSDMYGELEALILSMHNPVIRESLLIPVAPAYEADVREFLAEFAAVCWGFVELLGGEQREHYRAYLERAADEWGVDVDELEQRLNPQAPPGD